MRSCSSHIRRSVGDFLTQWLLNSAFYWTYYHCCTPTTPNLYLKRFIPVMTVSMELVFSTQSYKGELFAGLRPTWTMLDVARDGIIPQYQPESDSEFLSSAESESWSTLKLSTKFEKAFHSLDFKKEVQSKWKWSGATINKLEIEAFLLGIRHMTSYPRSHGHRILFFTDLNSILGALTKGRFSS